MPFPLLRRLVCIVLVGCLVLPPLEAATKSKSKSKSSGSSKSKRSKKSSGKSKSSKGKKGKSSKSKGKKGKKGKKGVDYSARPSTPQKRSSELPMTYAEWEKQQKRR